MKKNLEKKKTENLETRPPVVVVLGHVDHGKSSILEAIKDLKITEKESGGITQHIGAYEVEMEGNPPSHPPTYKATDGQSNASEGRRKITFIDTPGHEAFSAIRSRGAQVADIAILVVDACDGVQTQTKEAITIAKKAEIPMVVVLNKIDKPEANPERVKRQLSELDVLVESIGGKIPSINVSAKTKQGIGELLELILLVAEMNELKTNTKIPAEGIVIESYIDSLRGPMATLILKNGVLQKKDIIGTHSTIAKIKNLEDFRGKPIEKALPSQPVIVLGFEKVPAVGEKIKSFPTAEAALEYIKKTDLKKEISSVVFVESGKKVLNVVLKTDFLGSLEAIIEVLKGLPQEKVILRILKGDVGDINESDVKLAEMAKAQIIGFRVKTGSAVVTAMKRCKEKKVKIKTFEVIYDLIQDVRQIMERLVAPETVRKDLGKVKALIIFKTEKNRQIVGGKVIEGEIKKGLQVEVIHNGEIVGAGKLVNLQRNKKDAERLIKGDECGILYEGNVKIQEKDILVMYIEEKVKTGL